MGVTRFPARIEAAIWYKNDKKYLTLGWADFILDPFRRYLFFRFSVSVRFIAGPDPARLACGFPRSKQRRLLKTIFIRHLFSMEPPCIIPVR
jgi:hypothetical protein